MATFNPSRFSDQQLGLIGARNTAVRSAQGNLGVKVEGLAELRKSLRTLDRRLARELGADIKEAMTPVLEEARSLAPRQSGRLAASLRPFVRGNAAGIRSPLPYASVIHWGGSTGRGHIPGRPWSGSVLVRESLFISRAYDRREHQMLERLGDVMEKNARLAGWK